MFTISAALKNNQNLKAWKINQLEKTSHEVFFQV